MKRLALVFASLVLFIAAADDPYEAYIKKYSDIAVKEMQRSGVPASITLAQGLLESRAGQSPLAAEGNNHFGVKCHNDWTGKTMLMDDESRNECFRVYPNVEESFRDHSDFLRYQDRYKGLFDLRQGDYKAWARGLKKAGYATDPAYATKLIDLIERYGLDKYDSSAPVEIKTPLELEEPVAVVIPDKHFNEDILIPLEREVFSQNGARFVYAVEGEDYRSIAAANKLFIKEILKYNDVSEEQPLKAGDIVYLTRKKAMAAPGVDKYVVGEDEETLRDISQRFGVRLKSLEELNPILAGRKLAAGDTVILRK